MQAQPWEWNTLPSSFLLQLFVMLFDFCCRAPRRLRWESQMQRTRACNKDKWLEHEIWFIALVQKHSQGNSQHWHAMNFKTLSNPKKHTSHYNDIESPRATAGDSGPNQSGCCFWWMFLCGVLWTCWKGWFIQKGGTKICEADDFNRISVAISNHAQRNTFMVLKMYWKYNGSITKCFFLFFYFSRNLPFDIQKNVLFYWLSVNDRSTKCAHNK